MKKVRNIHSENLQLISKTTFIPTAIKCFKKYGFNHTDYDVEEVVSEATLKVAMNMDMYDSNRSKTAWFSKIAYNCAIDYINAESKRRYHISHFTTTTVDGEEYEYQYPNIECDNFYNPDEQLYSKERLEIIKKGIDSLNAKARLAITLKSQDYSYDEISEALGVNEGACRTIISRVRKELIKNPNIQNVYSGLKSCA